MKKLFNSEIESIGRAQKSHLQDLSSKLKQDIKALRRKPTLNATKPSRNCKLHCKKLLVFQANVLSSNRIPEEFLIREKTHIFNVVLSPS